MAERIGLITLDLDDTLWPCFPTIIAAERSLFAWIEQRAPALAADHDLDSLREHRQSLARRRPEIAHDMTGLRLQSLLELGRDYGLGDEFAHSASDHFRRERNRVRPFEDVIPALRVLGRYYVLVSVSNGNAQIEHTPLAGCFDHSFLAEEVGAAKPHPALFEAASRVSRIPLDRALHVGDDPVRDVEAARSAGMRTAWVNREQRSWPDHLAPADFSIGSLEQLCTSLKNNRV